MKSKEQFLAELEELKSLMPKKTYEEKLSDYKKSLKGFRKAIKGTTYKQHMDMEASAPLAPKKETK